MTLSHIVPTDVVIDLDEPPKGHRLAELLQVLTGCGVERAELLIGDPMPATATPSEALDVLARAMVAVRHSRSPVAPAHS